MHMRAEEVARVERRKVLFQPARHLTIWWYISLHQPDTLSAPELCVGAVAAGIIGIELQDRPLPLLDNNRVGMHECQHLVRKIAVEVIGYREAIIARRYDDQILRLVLRAHIAGG